MLHLNIHPHLGDNTQSVSAGGVSHVSVCRLEDHLMATQRETLTVAQSGADIESNVIVFGLQEEASGVAVLK